MINIELENFNKFFNEFNKEEINDELSKYIEKQTKFIKSEKIIINIKGKYTGNQKKKLTNLIHKHYEKLDDVYIKVDKFDDLYRIMLIFMGAILVVISKFIEFFISEIILITGWVVVWESVYDFIFNRVKRKYKKKIYYSLANSQIKFDE